jgi:hypothetical protein
VAVAVDYVIFLTDLGKVNALNASYPNGIQIPPTVAAATFGVPPPGNQVQNLNQTGGIAVFPFDSIGSNADYSSAFGTETFSITYPDTNPPGAGFPDPYPLTLSCFWVGRFAYTGGVNTLPAAGANPRYLGNRHFICGFEIPSFGDGGSGQATHSARAASRTPDGMGFAYRNENNSGNRTFSYTGTVKVAWHRFYLRIVTLPTGGDDVVWFCNGSVEAGASMILNINTNGTLQAYGKGNAAYPGQSIGTSSTVLSAGTWYRIDLRAEYLPASSPTNTVRFDLYINGTFQFTGQSSDPASGQHFSTASVGEDVSATKHGLEADFDDWISADEVSITDQSGKITKYPGHDLTTGSHVQVVRPTSFGTGHNTAAWNGVGAGVPGAVQELDNLNDPDSTSVGLTSTTVSAKIVVNTDYSRQQSGAVAATLGAHIPTSSGGATVQVQLNSNPATTLTITSAWVGSTVYSVGSGATADSLPDIGPFTITFISNGGAGTTLINNLMGSVEFLGAWGSEDLVAGTPGYFDTRVGIHNSAYKDLQANHAHVAPITAVRIFAGTYVGNNIGQDIFEKFPAHWFWVRVFTGSNYSVNGGGVWYSGMNSPHHHSPQKFAPSVLSRMSLDQFLNAKFGVPGDDAQTNSSTQSYQFIAISDPGMRFMLNGAFSHLSSLASATNPLVDSAFTPDCGFLFLEDFTSGSAGHFFKGPGNSGNHAQQLDGSTGDVANIATFSAGSIASLTAIHTDSPQTAFSLWRKSDGSAQAQWFDVVTWTGNGAGGTRNITVSLNGKAPLFAIACDASGPSYFRDPQHTGGNSAKINVGDNVANAIVGGAANQLQVGTALNANGVVYQAFVIGGGSTAFTNGAFTAAGEIQRFTQGPWAANPGQVAITPVTITSNNQWVLQRFDFRGSRGEHL